MSRDVQTPQPSLRYSEFPLASICQCLPPASQPYCHHSEESGSRPQAEAQSKLSTFPPVQSSQQSGLCCLSYAPSSLPQSSPKPRAWHVLLLLLPSPMIALFPCSALAHGRPDHSSPANKILQGVRLPTHESFLGPLEALVPDGQSKASNGF